jgi:Icc protein
MNIAQITDIHIDKAGNFPNDVDVRNNFKKVLSLVQTFETDRIILSGDLCYLKGDEDVYAWVKYQLDETGIPYNVIPGNHDSSKMLAAQFNMSAELRGNELYYSRNWDKNKWIFLDSAIGRLSLSQIEWLAKEIQNLPEGSDVFVVIHHPPIFGGVKHMDTLYSLNEESKAAIQQILLKHPGIVHVFCGHYHTDKTITKGNMCVHITPSCFVQIDPRFDKFQPDHYLVGFRHIQIQKDLVQSAVHYCINT